MIAMMWPNQSLRPDAAACWRRSSDVRPRQQEPLDLAPPSPPLLLDGRTRTACPTCHANAACEAATGLSSWAARARCFARDAAVLDAWPPGSLLLAAEGGGGRAGHGV